MDHNGLVGSRRKREDVTDDGIVLGLGKVRIGADSNWPSNGDKPGPFRIHWISLHCTASLSLVIHTHLLLALFIPPPFVQYLVFWSNFYSVWKISTIILLTVSVPSSIIRGANAQNLDITKKCSAAPMGAVMVADEGGQTKSDSRIKLQNC